jgi:hypothetical protein
MICEKQEVDRSLSKFAPRIEQMLREVQKRRLGKSVAMVPQHMVDDGINATRQLLGICQFDAGPCAEGIKALKNYRKDWDGERGVWKDRPRHDSASHGADAFRSLAMTYRDIPVEAKPYDGPYDPLGDPIEPKPRTWKYLAEMTYDEFHRETGSEIGKRARRRVWV